MERLANLAIDLVITRDEFLGSIEGLECIMIESMYQANIGSLRRSWVSNRKAMGIAQLMRLDRSDHRTQFEVLDPNTRCHPQIMWFRIVFLDRQLSLLLGLSQGSLDCSMVSDVMLQIDTPMGRLERIHCVLSSKILERNASSSHSMPDDYSTMKTLDLELQKAARELPSKWWLVPTLNAGLTDSQALFWDTRRLFAQVLHYQPSPSTLICFARLQPGGNMNSHESHVSIPHGKFSRALSHSAALIELPIAVAQSISLL